MTSEDPTKLLTVAANLLIFSSDKNGTIESSSIHSSCLKKNDAKSVYASRDSKEINDVVSSVGEFSSLKYKSLGVSPLLSASKIGFCSRYKPYQSNVI